MDLQALFDKTKLGYDQAQALEMDLRCLLQIPQESTHWICRVSSLFRECVGAQNELLVSFMNQLELWVATELEVTARWYL